MNLRTLIFLAVASAVMVTGCGKKDKADESATSSDMPEMDASTTDTAGESDDIFDEFYSDSGTTDESAGYESETAESEDSYAYESDYTPSFDPNGPYVVQVSCVGSYAIGESVVRELESKGYPSYLAEVQNPTPDLIGTYYRVRIGGFNGVSDGRRFGEDFLIPAGYDFWVDNRSNDNVGMGGYGLGESGTGDAAYEDEYYSEPAQGDSEGWGTSSTYDENASAGENTYEETETDYSSQSETGYEEETYESTPSETVEPAAADVQAETGAVQTEEALNEESPAETTEDETDSEDNWSDDEWDDSSW